MEYKRIVAAAMSLTLAAVLTGCSGNSSSSESNSDSKGGTSDSAETTTEAATEEELVPPTPTEATDPNTITFDDGNFSFAEIVSDDDDSATGTLKVTEVQGNKMLMYEDSGTNCADGSVQKIKIDAAKVLSHENVAKVRSIELDVYADATSDAFVNDDKENVKAPGWIGGGGGANVSGDKWYQFGEWSGGEYNFEMSGAAHATFKFLLADSGQCWDADMDEAVFLVMRWGAQNEGNMYIDNIVFYDENGKSLPLKLAEKNDDNEKISDNSDEIEKEEELPDGGKKVTYSNGEVHVYDADGAEDLDKFEYNEAETAPTENITGYDSEGNMVL
ncbi:MAG: hypothetical protein K5979_04335 [Ruminococcus sp.]|nr:hypothetical protein [Ruminococcus sp.]